jgi:hypothetical protein
MEQSGGMYDVNADALNAATSAYFAKHVASAEEQARFFW